MWQHTVSNYQGTKLPATLLLYGLPNDKRAANFAAYGVPIESIVVTKGEPKTFDITADSGRTNSRRFCPDCGSRIWAQIDELGLASVNAFALDDRSHFKPSSNHCPESAPAWCEIDENLEFFPRIPRENTS